MFHTLDGSDRTYINPTIFTDRSSDPYMMFYSYMFLHWWFIPYGSLEHVCYKSFVHRVWYVHISHMWSVSNGSFAHDIHNWSVLYGSSLCTHRRRNKRRFRGGSSSWSTFSYLKNMFSCSGEILCLVGVLCFLFETLSYGEGVALFSQEWIVHYGLLVHVCEIDLYPTDHSPSDVCNWSLVEGGLVHVRPHWSITDGLFVYVLRRPSSHCARSVPLRIIRPWSALKICTPCSIRRCFVISDSYPTDHMNIELSDVWHVCELLSSYDFCSFKLQPKDNDLEHAVIAYLPSFVL